MDITKIETNIKRKLYFYETHNTVFSKRISSLEDNIVSVNPDISFQDIIRIWRSFY